MGTLSSLRRGLVAAALASGVVLCGLDLTAAQGRGRIEGTVRLTVARGARAAVPVYGKRSAGAPVVRPAPEMVNVVVHLVGVPATEPPRPVKATITQVDEEFVPHVVAVPVGSTVEFPNDDPFFHNVFSLSGAASFDLGRYPPGESRSRRFAKPGVVKVYCQIHSHMSAVIRVFDHPWFAIPGDAGQFALEDVPAGERTIVAWHERVGEQRLTVTVAPGHTAKAAFTLPVLEPEP